MQTAGDVLPHSGKLLRSGRPEWEVVNDPESPTGRSIISRGEGPKIKVRHKARRVFAYRNGEMVEITGENLVPGRARYPLIKMSDRNWNTPK